MIFEETYKGKRVLVTGNTGLVGSWLSIWLLQAGAKMYGISKEISNEPCVFSAANLKDRVQTYWVDINNYDALFEAVKEIKPDFIFHAAARALTVDGYLEPLLTFQTNIIGTANLLQAIRVNNIPCTAVFMTSDKCYYNNEWEWGYRETDRLGGKDPYSASKAGAELVIHAYYKSFFDDPDCPVGILSVRAGNIIGGGDWSKYRIIPDCVKAWQSDKPVEIRNHSAVRPWQHVLEPVSGYLLAAKMLATKKINNGNAYNFGPSSESNVAVKDLVQSFYKYYSAYLGSAFIISKSEKLFKESSLLKLSCDKALFDLRWKPRLSFEDATRLTAHWYMKYYEKKVDMFEYTVKQIEEYSSLL